MYSTIIRLLKDSSFPVWILSFYVFIWYLQIGDRISVLGSIRIEFIVGTILIFIAIKEYFNSNKNSFEFHRGFVKTIFLLYFIFVIYTFASYDRENSIEVFSDRILKFSMFTLFIGTLVKTKSELVMVLLGFFLAMFKIAEEGIIGILGGSMIWQNQGIPRLHGVTKMYRHPNSLSGLAVSALPFFLFLMQFQTRIIKCAFLGAIGGLIAIVLYTGSRTGYIAVLVLFFAVLLRLGIFKPRTIVGLLAIIILASIFTPQDYKDRFGTLFKSQDEMGSSANKRIEILEDALQIAQKYPLGVGVQAFPYVRNMEFGRLQDTHNLYMEVYTNLGPIGFIVFCVFIYKLFKVNLTSRKLFMEKDEKFLAEVCYVVNLYILCRLTLGLFGMDLYEVYWWFSAGLTIALANMAAQAKIEPAPVANPPDKQLNYL